MKLQAKGVKSVRSRVVNLRDFRPDLTLEELRAALVKAFGEVYGLPVQTLTEEELDADELAAGQARFSDPAWIYGDSQPLEVSREAAFPWGILRVDHSQADGVITQAALWSDGLEGDFLSLVPETLAGCPKNAEDIRTRLSALPGSQAEMVEDILSLLIKE